MKTPPRPHINPDTATKVQRFLPRNTCIPTLPLADALPIAPLRPEHPQQWWRTPCQAADQVFVSGDLDTINPAAGQEQLNGWVALGITDIIDVRDEWSDADFVVHLAPSIMYHHFGTDDLDRGQPDEWFAKGVGAALEALGDPDRRVMVHCHMGVNRGPSMAFAILLALGVAPVAALEAIRGARPIAGIIYALDALRWWHHHSAAPHLDALCERTGVDWWMAHNDVDVSWIVSRIHQAGSAS